MNFGFVNLYVVLFIADAFIAFSFFLGSRSVLQLSNALIVIQISRQNTTLPLGDKLPVLSNKLRSSGNLTDRTCECLYFATILSIISLKMLHCLKM